MFGKYAQYQPCARASAIPKKPQLKRGKQKQQNIYSSPFTGFLPTRGGGYGVYTYGCKSTIFSSYPRAFIYCVTGSNMESNPEQTCLAEFSSSFGLLRWHGDSRRTSEAPLRQPTTEQCARSVPSWTMCFSTCWSASQQSTNKKSHKKKQQIKFCTWTLEKKIWINKMVGMTGGVLLVLAFL